MKRIDNVEIFGYNNALLSRAAKGGFTMKYAEARIALCAMSVNHLVIHQIEHQLRDALLDFSAAKSKEKNSALYKAASEKLDLFDAMFIYIEHTDMSRAGDQGVVMRVPVLELLYKPEGEEVAIVVQILLKLTGDEDYVGGAAVISDFSYPSDEPTPNWPALTSDTDAWQWWLEPQAACVHNVIDIINSTGAFHRRPMVRTLRMLGVSNESIHVLDTYVEELLHAYRALEGYAGKEPMPMMYGIHITESQVTEKVVMEMSVQIPQENIDVLTPFMTLTFGIHEDTKTGTYGNADVVIGELLNARIVRNPIVLPEEDYADQSKNTQVMSFFDAATMMAEQTELRARIGKLFSDFEIQQELKSAEAQQAAPLGE
jgi:hypothetical protein